MIRCLQFWILLLMLQACSDASCIDPDDFGFSHVTVPAGFSSSEIHGSGLGQYVDWYDSGLTLNGDNLYMIVQTWNPSKNINSAPELSAWCPWLGPSSSPPSLQSTCVLLDTCIFQNLNTCSNTSSALILNAPCLLKNGVGLYFAATPRSFDPNTDADTNAKPYLANTNVLEAHMGSSVSTNNSSVTFYSYGTDSSGNLTYSASGGYYASLSSAQVSSLTGGKLYFKILDRYYQDNSGQYIVTIKSGVTKTAGFVPSTIVSNYVKGLFFGVNADGNPPTYVGMSNILSSGLVVKIFNNIISNSNYQMCINALLSMFIMYHAFQFMIGGTHVSQKSLLILILKVIIVSRLLTSSTAWSFFSQYLFFLFLDGSAYLVALISGEFAGVDIFSLLLSPQLYIKIFALPWAGSADAFGLGIAYTLVFLVCIAITIYSVFYSITVYLTCLMMMGALMMLAPIFISFILFDFTKNLFNTWLKEFASYALQSVILVAGIAMITLMLKDQIYKNLGFRVCKDNLYSPSVDNAFNTSLVGSAKRTPSLYIWKPHFSATESMVYMPIPLGFYAISTDSQGYVTNTEDTLSSTYCPPYECFGNRYPSFPFLDPSNAGDAAKLARARSGELVSSYDLLLITACTLLMFTFTSHAITMAAKISDGIDMTKTSDKIWNNTKELTKAAPSAVESVKDGVRGVYHHAQDARRWTSKYISSQNAVSSADSDAPGENKRTGAISSSSGKNSKK
ncbi:MAG: type IV secretion system protein [Rickettsiaceae bacterium]|nr:type IV secretion system protein [Rickettsiaceae bacterium]